MISTRTTDEGITEIVVSDDGPGTSDQLNASGTGTSIIDSWVGILKGRKEIDSVPGHGVLVAGSFSCIA